jgi:DNA-binding cell septation regulator SpoVG
LSVAIVKWRRLDPPIGKTLGFAAISWHGLIVEGFVVNDGPHGPFLDLPKRRGANGRWYEVARFSTVAEREAFRREAFAALMRVYPQDFEGLAVRLPPNMAIRTAETLGF